MIKVTVQYNDHLVDIHFPCSETTLHSALMEIHAADDNPPELFVTDVIFPEELGHLKDRFVNLDELNYLAKRMESFFGTEEEQFYEAMKQEGFTELKDLINLSFNLNKYCLIQNIGNMGKIGQEYLLNRDGSIPANDDANPKYAEIGRRLMQSGTGIVTEHGILFVDEDVQFQELYDGQVFPPYLYDSSILCTAKAEYHGKVEYLYLPCERAAIDKSIGRLGAPDAESVSIILDDFMVDNPEWMRRLREMTSSESIYDINDLVGAISNADMTELLVCGECKTPYRRCTWTVKGQKKIVWRCINRLDFGKKYCHNSPTVEESILQRAVMRAIMETAQQNLGVLQTLKVHIGMGLQSEQTEDNSMELQIRIAEIDAAFKAMLAKISTDTVDAFDEEKAKQLMDEKARLQQQLGNIRDGQLKREQIQSRLDDIYTILDGLKNRPMEYDEQIVRQLLECITVDSKEQITVIFVGGLKVVQPLID